MLLLGLLGSQVGFLNGTLGLCLPSAPYHRHRHAYIGTAGLPICGLERKVGEMDRSRLAPRGAQAERDFRSVEGNVPRSRARNSPRRRRPRPWSQAWKLIRRVRQKKIGLPWTHDPDRRPPSLADAVSLPGGIHANNVMHRLLHNESRELVG
ncbi:hypothetical protein GGR52DRAFT_426049 [Hypoxylon sp. FL1284]|nr:hypothetical protein GGR52DRAFT_426049 [Hypoxylon sp. FL1284]